VIYQSQVINFHMQTKYTSYIKSQGDINNILHKIMTSFLQIEKSSVFLKTIKIKKLHLFLNLIKHEDHKELNIDLKQIKK